MRRRRGTKSVEKVSAIVQAAWSWLGVPSDMTFWQAINSEFIVAVIVLFFGVAFNRKVNRLNERAENEDLVRGLEDQLEEKLEEQLDDLPAPEPEPALRSQTGSQTAADMAPPQSTPREVEEIPASKGNRLQDPASHIFHRAKKFVDARLERQTDSRKKRTYSFIGKRDYRLRVLAAQEDKLIKPTQVLDLIRIFEIWRLCVNSRFVMLTPELLEEMNMLINRVELAADDARVQARELRTRPEEA